MSQTRTPELELEVARSEHAYVIDVGHDIVRDLSTLVWDKGDDIDPKVSRTRHPSKAYRPLIPDRSLSKNGRRSGNVQKLS
jgi:hypothetical protein